MLAVQEISDRFAIQDVLARYGFAMDDRDWDALDELFAPDAVLDFSAAGGPKGGLEDFKAWLPDMLATFPRIQHMVSLPDIRIDGDAALCRSIVFNPMVMRMPNGTEQVMFIGLSHRDRLVRTPEGWRIRERIEDITYTHNTPG
tara:strand:- start:10699 stop:11130 length:432 start_codon:yes stop_codon:yes gene_type:complete